jgi:hypothetical protein
VLALAVAAAWRYRDPLLAALTATAASPGTQLRDVLARQGRATLDVGAGARAELSPVRFGDVAVQVDAGGQRAEVLAVVDAQGAVTWRGERAGLGYVGREAFAMARCPAARWCPDGPQLPALRGVLTALRGRADAEPDRHVRAWQIRVERERATAGEDYDLVLPGGVERRRAVHTLRRAGAGWVFVDGP